MSRSDVTPWMLPVTTATIAHMLLVLFLHSATAMSGWGGCLDGQDVFAMITENTLSGELITELNTDVSEQGIRWSVAGKDADWFLLDGENLRLNSSPEKTLDREVQGPVLMAELVCYEDDRLQSMYRIMVEILNENDNSPVFAENTIQSLVINELTPVNTVLFTVHAEDADNDQIIYSIDQESPDAEYFRLDLPNNGEVKLAKPLDYETKSLLTVTIHASEMNTAERFNISTTITIDVLDGDDQYPQFLPCTLLYQDQFNRICTNPVYTVNVTEGQEDVVLDFSPGPIHAVDGDRGLNSPISYTLLSGGDDGRFLMDKRTGEVRLMQAVKDRLTTPILRLRVMAYQDDDPRKYTVASVLVQIRAVNCFPPEFDRAEYRGFVNEAKRQASLLNTYGSKVLVLRVQDHDFMHGFNPMIYFTFSPASNYTDLYQITQEGLVIARPNQLEPNQRHILQVLAVDQESGDVTSTSIVVEVLPEGIPIPLSPLGEERLTSCVVGKALVLCVLCMTVLGCILSMMSWLMRKHKGYMDPLERGCVAQGKHPNVSLRWFQLVSQGSPIPQTEEVPFNDGDLGIYNPSFSLQDKPPGVYIHRDLPPCRGLTPPSTTAAPDTSVLPAEAVCSPVFLNNAVSPPIKCSSSMPVMHPPVTTESHLKMPPKTPTPKERDGSPTPSPDGAPHSVEAPVDPDPPTASLLSIEGLFTPPAVSSDPQPTPSLVSLDPEDVDVDSSPRPPAPETDSPYDTPRSVTPPGPSRSHSDTPPLDTPPETPEGMATSRSTDAPGATDLPSASSDPTDPENAQGGRREGAGVEDEGLPGENQDADKTSEEEDDELEPDEEELLRVLARLHPVFISIRPK